MLRTYKLEQHANKGKEQKIASLFKAYRKSARAIAAEQWMLVQRDGKTFDKNNKSKIDSQLSARYIQTCQYQVVGMLKSYISNTQNRFVDKVRNSSLDEQTKIQLFYINKYKLYYRKQVKCNKKVIPEEIMWLSRRILNHLMKHKPRYNHINLNLDNKVVQVTKNDGTSCFGYWAHVSTLISGKKISIPIETNEFFESIDGNLKNFIQINQKGTEISTSLIKEVENKQESYIPKTPKIAIDTGLKILFATNQGDLFGRGFYKKILYFDNLINKKQKLLKKNNVRLLQSKEFVRLCRIRRNYVKNEINKAINRIVKLYQPSEIVLEDLNFQHSNLGKQTNRLLNTFGKRQIENKLESIAEEYGIIITKVHAAYTSQLCSSCGYVAENNRKSQSEFRCRFCGNTKNADVNGAKTIFRRSSWELLMDKYLSRKKILQILLKSFLERYPSLLQRSSEACTSSSAKDVVYKNPYFIDYVQKNLPCNICI